ncbi:exodeoxyribonuclease III [Cyanobacterium sp. IPPAS B-1200]|uniref:exodeoxyribonuclease III n=1 Tax=Cyanobacterium sp. IPPAS B-1200 TaxID=1562720 RepID=UPI00085281B5|nr:exodeoxyribonuclease III [Cyanobacterium sp. IPPAS B-1200]OEJ79438.1 exodeoxyribonuclease III [Cyanobacterium sp. IPPAS B-1200]
MKIATWNVNSIRTREDHVKKWLVDQDIDILCLQETKVIDKDFPRQGFIDLGYHVYVYGQKAYNGVAIFSKKPLESIDYGFNDILNNQEKVGILDEQKRVISGVIDNIRIVNLYVPNGNSLGSEKYEYKLQWLELLQEYLTTISPEKTDLLVCGDFNIALEDKDIYKPEGREKHVMATPTEREALKSVLRLGLTDVFRQFHPEEGHFSWWDYRQGGFAKNRGWRIDHIYLSPSLLPRAMACNIDVEPRKLVKPSDHAPVVVEISL